MARRPLSTAATVAASIEKPIPKANENRAEVVIHRPNGRIRDSDSYENDPRPPSGQR